MRSKLLLCLVLALLPAALPAGAQAEDGSATLADQGGSTVRFGPEGSPDSAFGEAGE